MKNDKKQNLTSEVVNNINQLEPITLINGKILNVLKHTSEKFGVHYIITIVHDNLQGHSINLIHNERENWLNRIVDAQKKLEKEYYEMILTNWSKIIKHLDDCIVWFDANTSQPKYPKGTKVKITNHESLKGSTDYIKDFGLVAFVGYYYILEELSTHGGSSIKFSENNLVSAEF